MEKKNIVEYLHEIESKSKPKIIHTKDPMKIEAAATFETSEIKERVSREKSRRIS